MAFTSAASFLQACLLVGTHDFTLWFISPVSIPVPTVACFPALHLKLSSFCDIYLARLLKLVLIVTWFRLCFSLLIFNFYIFCLKHILLFFYFFIILFPLALNCPLKSSNLPFFNFFSLFSLIFPSSLWEYQSSLCSPYDIIQCRLRPVCTTVQILVSLETTFTDRKQKEALNVSSCRWASGAPPRVTVATQTPLPVWQVWDLVSSSLLHILCLVLLFLAYSWIELT